MTLHANLFNGYKAEWDEYVHSNPYATNYHQLGWKEVIEKSFGHETFYLLARDGTGRIRGMLPLIYMKSAMFGKFMVSIPFFNYGGFLCDDDKAAEILLKEAKKILTDVGADHIELRHLRNYDYGLATKHHKITMILELEKDVDYQWKAFNAKLRNQIRKAIKSGLNIKIGHSEILDGFYDVFARNMRDLGTPVYSKDFFKNILRTFPDTTKIFAATLQKKVIASGIAIWFKDTFEMPWASSIRDYKSLCPNNLLYWEAIKFAIENGFKKFDFGRSTPHEGTYKFKEQWGARPVQLYWQYIFNGRKSLPELNPKNPKYQMAIKIWQKLPVFLTKIVGPPIVRNIP